MKLGNGQICAILDAGAQYGKVIDRRVRDLKVESVILPINTPWKELKEYGGIIISGGPDSVYAKNSPKCDPKVFTENKTVPVLGICYGMQLMNYAFGGVVEKPAHRQDGPTSVNIPNGSVFFAGLTGRQEVLMSHGDSVTKPPAGFKVTLRSEGLIAAIEDSSRQFYGVQFHPETDITVNGKKMLYRFLYNICGIRGTFTLENRKSEAIRYIRNKVGKRPVLVLLSGGVDSTVLAVLLGKAVAAKQIHAVHIDTGYMRQDEGVKVKKALARVGIKLKIIDSSDTFYKAVGNAIDPEIKRKTIGDVFIKVARKTMLDLGFTAKEMFLAQGTLRPDLIESASTITSSRAEKIKTHHNDSPLARAFRDQNRIVEPLQDYHKDEVRKLGKLLGLPKDLVWRQPFPGPGLSLRVLCTNQTSLKADVSGILKKLKKYSSRDHSLTLLPIKTVGVQGDGRSYKYVVGISGKPNWKKLFELAREIPREVHEINRVVYVFGKKLPEKVIRSLTPTTLNSESLTQVRLADDIVNKISQKHGLNMLISQLLTISSPVSFDKKGLRSITLRTFITNDFMTGVPAVPDTKYMPIAVLNKMVKEVSNKVPGISRVMYDLTSKPPGTTEWE